MSIAVLYEVHQEVRRLFIAGSGVAAGDFRLSKLLPQLQKLGESAPVFRRLAEAIQQTLEANSESSSVKLLELGTLLHSILYTQGSSELSGELKRFEPSGSLGITNVHYRKLRPLIDALTQRGPGRLEIVRQAKEEGLFHDMRTHIPAVVGLEDTYTEIADYLAEAVIPSIGAPVLPILMKQFQLNGGKADARKLLLIHRIGGIEYRELFQQAVDAGSTDVRLAAIDIWSNYAEFEGRLVELSRDKKKEVRRAALFALAKHPSDKAIDALMNALAGKDYSIALEPIQDCLDDHLTARLLVHANELFNKVTEGTLDEQTVERLATTVHCLEGRRTETVENYLISLVSNPSFNRKETDAVREHAAKLLLHSERQEAYAFLRNLHTLPDQRLIAYSFEAALRDLPPATVYEDYSPQFRNKEQFAAKELLRVMYNRTQPLMYAWDRAHKETADIQWDSRWVHVFVEINEEELVCRLADEQDRKVISYLADKWKVAPQMLKPRTASILFALYKLRYKETPELLLQSLEGAAARQIYYLDRDWLSLIRLLPAKYTERLEKFAEKLTYESVKQQMLEVVESVKANVQDESNESKGAGWIEWMKSKLL
ncbi:HEAT repeat domain-containing protein [Paenibacillus radicis (ex Xue et al. 2023)]|uniref:HEAT repeat domain-containing protein n=1 Tax=Paenibacillus radicis (ex Xue et al. 2023) TaxID=2972489 RepID=A0ABT1YA06_9BACL|nr:HEAT repeat domain-containing protein [Paenibacillus radicis (ex Xue et al. 2023)]MCR8630016.1 HEAT repeat domain-containing protein [Paenibacillus radicis (ex Xue et al. 2023)]